MNLTHTRSLFAIFFSLFIFGFQNCSKARFSADASANLSSLGTGNDSGCRANLVTNNKIIKVLFVVDTSGSNSQIPDGTDPNKKWRSATFNNFIHQYSGKTNFYYGLITFQGSSAKEQIVVNGSGAFTNDMTIVQSGYDSFMNTVDGGSTPYKAALTMARQIIAADVAANASQNASYVMLMVSDGMAKDYNSPDEVIPDANAIMAVAPGQVSLNSVYYYSTDFEDSETAYLRNISKVGNGSFIIANSNQVLSINDVIQLPATGCN
ncbi:MAG: VWA domain-containing protein [Pseudobdellovibrionaceae bacterium]